jgi:hypothetical protein
MKNDTRLAYVGKRAYELAQTGEHEDFASIQQAIIDEGYAESVPWLEVPGVMAAIAEICAVSRTQGGTSEGAR